MALDPEGVVEFKSGGKKYRLYFGMRAMKEIELHYDKPFGRAVQGVMPALSAEDLADPAKVAAASADIRVSDVAKLFEFALLKHHPTLDEDAVNDLMDDLGLEEAGSLLGDALTAAMVKEAGESSQNPPQASRKRKTGSRS
jgi:hypothetical protein